LQENKKLNKLWNDFRKTGSVIDYLEYSKQKRKNKYNNEENNQK
jgi:hypothetical protein